MHAPYRTSTIRRFRFVATLRAAALAACLAAGSAIAGPVPWADAPFSHYATNTPLEAVLAEFASNFSLTLSMQPGLGGAVNGRFNAKNPTEFISRLAGVYGFTWYTHAGTLYVSKASETMTRSLTVPGGSLGNLRQALLDLGVLEPRFGWGELGDQGVIMVSGPPSYVKLVEATLEQLPRFGGAQQVVVFRLRHASAEDRVILYRDREITQPGLASVLRNLVSNRGAGGGVGSDTSSAPVTQARPGAGMSPDGGAAAPATGTLAAGAGSAGIRTSQAATSGRRVEGRNQAPSIQSDPRLNALVVQDVPERIPMYAKLIEQLDVPTALIEIEAMIIDINSDKAGELGINWAGRAGNGTAAGFGELVQQPQAGTLSIVHATSGNIVTSGSLAANAGTYLISQIRLLETNGDARVQSRPSVLTSDNTGALLDLSETFYVKLQGERVASLTPVTAGTTLRVTPRVIEDGGTRVVQLTVDIEDGQIQSRQVDTLPTVARSTVSTQAIVRQGDALVIAGHSADRNIDSTQRVPFLGD
ncbi:MAG: type III secretion system outer membrane ring subunit SctC, partial [Ramlibacter sp.]